MELLLDLSCFIKMPHETNYSGLMWIEHIRAPVGFDFLPATPGSLSLNLCHSLSLSIGVRVSILCVSASLGDIPTPVGGLAEISALSKKSIWAEYHHNLFKSCDWNCTGIRSRAQRKWNYSEIRKHGRRSLSLPPVQESR